MTPADGGAAERPSYWLVPINPHGGGCLCCGSVPAVFDLNDCIAVGFGFAACTKDGAIVLEEPRPSYDDNGEMLDDDQHYPTGADAEKLAVADPDHDWRIMLESPLLGRTFQRQGAGNWVLVEQNAGFA